MGRCDFVRCGAAGRRLHHHDGPAAASVLAAACEHTTRCDHDASDHDASGYAGRNRSGNLDRRRARAERFRNLQSVCGKELR